MPPKPEPKVFVPLSETYYAALMAADAKKVRKRYGRTFGSPCPAQTGNDANRARNEAARTARAEMAERIAGLLAAAPGPMLSREIQNATGASQNHTRVVMTEMLAAGRVIKGRVKGACTWVLTATPQGGAA
jgi:hypothetical protein